MMNSVKNTLAYQAAKPSKDNLGLRSYQLHLGQEALQAGELAQALKWFTLAALPRASDKGEEDEKIRLEAVGLEVQVKNTIAAIEMQKQSSSPQSAIFPT